MTRPLAQQTRVLQSALDDQRPVAMHDMFTAWRLSGSKAIRIASEGNDLASALQSAQLVCSHKDRLFILQTDRRSGDKMLHCYVIKQGARQYRGITEGWVCPLKADPLFSMPVIDFAPDEPWTWSPGADVVGFDRSEVSA